MSLADAAYTDSSGETHRLSVIVNDDPVEEDALEVGPRSTVRLSLWPKDWSRGSSDGRPVVWKGDSPLDGRSTIETSRDRALADRQGDVGKGFEVLVPLTTREGRVSYRFRFTVSGLVARRTLWA